MNSSDYGVPQVRERVFAVGLRKDLNNYFVFPDVVEKSEIKTLRDAIGDLPDPDNKNNHYCCGEKLIGDEDDLPNLDNHDKYFNGDYSTRYLSRNRQKQWDEPSFTIVSQAKQLPLHPEPANYDIRTEDIDKCPPPRRFTVRECLRIQSVPDWFNFSDKVSLNKQYERCSGIPSLIAYKLGIRIAEHLRGEIGQQSLF
jgi:site-specific DNA-cytosine methylase